MITGASRLRVSAFLLVAALPAGAWDYAGHRVVNELAWQSLPREFPAFVRTAAARERIAFLGGEPDRWRNTPDHSFRHLNEPDHFFDLDYLSEYGLKPDALPPFRYEFVAHLARVRATRPDVPPAVNAARDPNRTQALFGFLPWAVNEHYSKLKSAFSYLKTFEQHGGTPEEIRNAQENILFLMGVMGHFVGDAAQPLHTTKHFNGWVGPNPNRYTTNRTFHAWIDGGYLTKVGLDAPSLAARLRPARLVDGANAGNLGVFQPVMNFILQQHELVEPLYRLDKEGRLSGNGTVGLQGKPFLEEQILKAGQMLGDLWLTAWQTAPADKYLQAQLARRKLNGQTPPKQRR
jgi:hypothetical protein